MRYRVSWVGVTCPEPYPLKSLQSSFSGIPLWLHSNNCVFSAMLSKRNKKGKEVAYKSHTSKTFAYNVSVAVCCHHYLGVVNRTLLKGPKHPLEFNQHNKGYPTDLDQPVDRECWTRTRPAVCRMDSCRASCRNQKEEKTAGAWRDSLTKSFSRKWVVGCTMYSSSNSSPPSPVISMISVSSPF